MFLTYGALGFAWLVLWLPLVPARAPANVLADVAAASSAYPDKYGLQEGVEGRPPGGGGEQAAKGPSAEAKANANANAEANGALLSSSLPSTSPPLPEKAFPKNGDAIITQTEVMSAETAVMSFDGNEEGLASSEPLAAGSFGGGRRSVAVAATAAAAVVVGGKGEDGGMVPSKSPPGGIGDIIGGIQGVPWKAYATNGQIWSIASAHMAHNWGLYVMLAWLPTYYNEVWCFVSVTYLLRYLNC